MNRLLVTIVALLGLVVPLTSCDALDDHVAARVGDHDITIDDVRAVIEAQAEGRQAEPRSTDARLDGDEARAALAELIQLAVFADVLEERGGTVDAEDRTAAEQSMATLPGLPDTLAGQMAQWYAARNALGRELAAETQGEVEVPTFTDAEVRAAAVELLAQVPPEELEQFCAEGVVGLSDTADGAERLIDAGTALDDAEAFAAVGYEPMGVDGEPYCGGVSSVLPEVGAALAGPVGRLERVDFAASDGSEATIFLRPTGGRTLTADSPEVLEQARASLEQTAQAEAEAALQAEGEKVVRTLLRDADVVVDSRFGSWDVEAGVLPPLTPLQPAVAGDTAPAATG